MLNQLKEMNPLIHCMTNMVVTTYTANGLLAIGSSPVMAYAKEEVQDMATAAGALLLNIGTPSVELTEAMILAGKAANKAGKPVILDPVGAGATAFRTDICHQILKEVDVSIVRGNAGEMAALVGMSGVVKGVDGSLDGDKQAVAKKVAEQYSCVAVLTGDVDTITDGERLYLVSNGHEWLTKVVGTGCLLGGVVAAFVSTVNKSDYAEAAAYAVSFYGAAAEKAYDKTKNQGYGSFAQDFIDQLGLLTENEAEQLRKVES
ncbi:hydroxyethylthiazole kinase [Alkalicoccobacillus plakortidis]|uniref:Hydroxyethylthiazole kinase n=1 Tax=Alkalicoccobacillus plakortidis TaxID=444060 RepID=A0ABT0XHP8_9BACI|nr:hydroxyethylthiazole kinase [Alkalicoccobacillus plakortidis]MCM2675438.1 hydroxyethylthiazole kinase [Alkalicoccobacillus plakortidis]